MFQTKIGGNFNSYGAYSDQQTGHPAPSSPAPVTPREELIKNFVAQVLANGVVPGRNFLDAGIPANRQEYVDQSLKDARSNYVAVRMQVMGNNYVESAIATALNNPSLFEAARAENKDEDQVKKDVRAAVEKSWKDEEDWHAAQWDESPLLKTQAIESAVQFWNALAVPYAAQLAIEALSSPQGRLPEAKGRAAALHSQYLADSGKGKERAQKGPEESVSPRSIHSIDADDDREDDPLHGGSWDIPLSQYAHPHGEGSPSSMQMVPPRRALSPGETVYQALGLPTDRKEFVKRVVDEMIEIIKASPSSGKTSKKVLKRVEKRAIELLSSENRKPPIPVESVMEIYKQKIQGVKLSYMVRHPQTREMVPYSTLRNNKEVPHPVTGEKITLRELYKWKKVRKQVEEG